MNLKELAISVFHFLSPGRELDKVRAAGARDGAAAADAYLDGFESAAVERFGAARKRLIGFDPTAAKRGPGRPKLNSR